MPKNKSCTAVHRLACFLYTSHTQSLSRRSNAKTLEHQPRLLIIVPPSDQLLSEQKYCPPFWAFPFHLILKKVGSFRARGYAGWQLSRAGIRRGDIGTYSCCFAPSAPPDSSSVRMHPYATKDSSSERSLLSGGVELVVVVYFHVVCVVLGETEQTCNSHPGSRPKRARCCTQGPSGECFMCPNRM